MSTVCQCPSCKAKYQLGDQFAGRKIKCPKCSAVVQVPEAVATTATKTVLPEAKTVPVKVAAQEKAAAQERTAAVAAKAAPAGSAVRAVKAEPIEPPAKALPRPEPLVEPPSPDAGADEAASSVDEEMALTSSNDDGFGFLEDEPLPVKRQSSRSGIKRPAIQDSLQDSSVLGDDFVARSGISSKIGSRSSKPGTSQLRKQKQKSAPVWMIAGMGGGCLLVALLVFAGIYWNSQSQPNAASTANAKTPAAQAVNPNVPTVTFTFRWPASERSGATLTINGERREIPVAGDEIKYKLPKVPQPYEFILERQGYERKKFTRPLTEDDDFNVTQWESSQPKGVVDWEQDFDAAKKAAADQHKDVLIVFDASDAEASSAASSRFNTSVASRSEFADRANKEYICVYIDNPEGDKAKSKVKNLDRNHTVTGNFEITVFPTVVVTDPRGRPFGVMDGYSLNGVNAFLVLMDKWQEDCKTLFDYLERSKESSDSDLVTKTLDFLELNKLDRFYAKTVKHLTQKLPNGGIREVTDQEAKIWAQRFQRSFMNPDEVKKVVDEFDRWKKDHKFNDPDMAAWLHFFAAGALARIDLRTEAAQKCKEGLAYEPHDSTVRAYLEEGVQELTGKPGEHHVMPVGSGTGFCIAQGNYVLTNHHVIDRAKKIMVHLNGTVHKYLAHLIADSEEGDMAVLKLDLPDEENLTPVPLVATDVGIGDDVCAFGWPGLLSQNPTSLLTNGLISTIHEKGYLVTNCKIDHGNSGGPLCSVSGCAIAGMVTAKTRTMEGVDESYGLAIPASKLKKFLREKLPHDVLTKIPRPTDATGTKLSDVVKRVQPSVVYVENYR